MTGGDGMCRPTGYNIFVFVGGRFAGTLSPAAMNSRDDASSGAVRILGADSLSAEFARYAAQKDALCCPSSRVTVRYRIDRAGAGPVVVPVEVRVTRGLQGQTNPAISEQLRSGDALFTADRIEKIRAAVLLEDTRIAQLPDGAFHIASLGGSDRQRRAFIRRFGPQQFDRLRCLPVPPVARQLQRRHHHPPGASPMAVKEREEGRASLKDRDVADAPPRRDRRETGWRPASKAAEGIFRSQQQPAAGPCRTGSRRMRKYAQIARSASRAAR